MPITQWSDVVNSDKWRNGDYNFKRETMSNYMEYYRENGDPETIPQAEENFSVQFEALDKAHPDFLKGAEGASAKAEKFNIGQELLPLHTLANAPLRGEIQPDSEGRRNLGFSGREDEKIEAHNNAILADQEAYSQKLESLGIDEEQANVLVEDYKRLSWNSDQTGGVNATIDSDGFISFNPAKILFDGGLQSIEEEINSLDTLDTAKQHAIKRARQSQESQLAALEKDYHDLNKSADDLGFISQNGIAKLGFNKQSANVGILGEVNRKVEEGMSVRDAIKKVAEEQDTKLESAQAGAESGLLGISNTPHGLFTLFTGKKTKTGEFVSNQDAFTQKIRSGVSDTNSLFFDVIKAGTEAIPQVGLGLAGGGITSVALMSAAQSASGTASDIRYSEEIETALANGELTEEEVTRTIRESGASTGVVTASLGFIFRGGTESFATQGVKSQVKSLVQDNIKSNIAKGVGKTALKTLSGAGDEAIEEAIDSAFQFAITENAKGNNPDWTQFTTDLPRTMVVASILGGTFEGSSVGLNSNTWNAKEAQASIGQLQEEARNPSPVTNDQTTTEEESVSEAPVTQTQAESLGKGEGATITDPTELIRANRESAERGSQVRDASARLLDVQSEADLGSLDSEVDFIAEEEIENVSQAQETLDLITDNDGNPVEGVEPAKVEALKQYINEQSEGTSGDANQERNSGDGNADPVLETNTQENSDQVTDGEGVETEGRADAIQQDLSGVRQETESASQVDDIPAATNPSNSLDDVQPRDTESTQPVAEAVDGGATPTTQEVVTPPAQEAESIQADESGTGTSGEVDQSLEGEAISVEANQDAGSTPVASTKTASEVQVGDTVVTNDGIKHLVRGVIPQENGDLELDFTDPSNITVSPDSQVKIQPSDFTDRKISGNNNSLGIVSPTMAEILTVEPVADNSKNRLQRGLPPNPNSATKLQKRVHFFESILFKNGRLPISTRKELADLESKKSSYQTLFTKLGDDLKNSIEKNSKNERESSLHSELSYRALKGDNSALSILPQPIKQSVLNGRRSIDIPSKKLIDDGVISGDLAKSVGDNIGKYILREFKVFDPESGWNYDNIKSEHPDVYNSALQYIMGSKGMSEVDADIVIQEMTDASRARSFYMGDSQAGKIDASSFIKRKDLPTPILNLLGEIRDPALNIARTGSKVTGIWATHESQQKVAQILLQQGFASRAKDGRNNTRVGATDVTYATIDAEGKPAVGKTLTTSKSMSGFGEIYMSPELAEAFETHFSPSNKNETFLDVVGSTLAKVSSVGKFNQVILNPAAYPTNAVGAFMVNLFNGYVSLNSFKAYGKSSRFNKSESPYTAQDQVNFYSMKVEDFRREGGSASIRPKQFEVEAEAYGLRDNNVAANDLLDTVNEGWKFTPSIMKNLSKAYQAPDNSAKRAAFAREIDKWSNALPDGSTMDKAIRLAAKDVKRVTQNYDMIPLFIKEMSQKGLGVATYISFTYELVRNTAETVRLTKEELMSDNPIIRKSGAMRLAGMASVAGLLYGLNEMIGGDDEERDAIKRSLAPPWLKGKGILYFGKDSQGRYRYADPSYIIPHQAFYNAINSVLKADSPDEAFEAFGDALKDNFGQLNIMMQTSAEMIANKKVSGGQIYNPEIEGDKESKLPLHLFDSMFKPGIWKTIEKSIEAGQGKTKSFGSTANWNDLAWNLIGVRPYTVDTKSPSFLEDHMSSFVYRHRDASSFDSAGKQAKRTLGEQAEAIEKVNASVDEIKEEAKNFYEDAMKMGVTKEAILKSEKAIKMPKQYRFKAIMSEK